MLDFARAADDRRCKRERSLLSSDFQFVQLFTHQVFALFGKAVDAVRHYLGLQ